MTKMSKPESVPRSNRISVPSGENFAENTAKVPSAPSACTTRSFDPSAETRWISVRSPTLALYAIVVPSGDHEGTLTFSAAATCTGSDPSASMTQMARSPSPYGKIETAILVPSGDHAWSQGIPGGVGMTSSPDPSGMTERSSKPPPVENENAIRPFSWGRIGTGEGSTRGVPSPVAKICDSPKTPATLPTTTTTASRPVCTFRAICRRSRRRMRCS
jgi:hypothetical protein